MMPFVIFQLTIPAMFLIVVFVFLLLCQITMDVWKSEPWFNLSTGSIKMKILKPALMFSHPNMNLLNGAKSWYSIDFVFYPPDQYLLIKHNIFDIHLLWQTIVFGAIAHPSLVAFHLQVKLFKRVKSSKSGSCVSLQTLSQRNTLKHLLWKKTQLDPSVLVHPLNCNKKIQVQGKYPWNVLSRYIDVVLNRTG